MSATLALNGLNEGNLVKIDGYREIVDFVRVNFKPFYEVFNPF